MDSDHGQIQPIRFVQDIPSPDDFFDTHTRIADAIASAISADPKLRTIGILGRWGSGKSTVIEQLSGSISKRSDLGNLKVFTFDAWVHQSEPIRRSFLEVLLAYLRDELATEDRWKKEMDILAGRVDETEQIDSPGLTSKTKLALLSLVPLPLGLSLLSEETISNGVGVSTTDAGQVIFLITALSFIIPIFVFLFLFLAERRKDQTQPPDPEDQIISIVLNRTITNKRTKTLRSPEPTAIEFRQTFDAIVDDLALSETRLLCVVDNLDRLPPSEAVEIWGAVQSLFLRPHSKNKGAGSTHPVVVVPMDKQALISVFQSDQTPDRERAESFIEKTFDITFRVPPPVMSEWRRFLDSQLAHVLPDRLSASDKFWVRRLFEAKWKGRNATPTPRAVNRLANAIASIVLERGDGAFDVPIIASFVVNIDRIEADVLKFVGSADAQMLAEIDQGWSDQIAALFYGVSREKGRQLLLTQPLTDALIQQDASRFAELMDYPGAAEILEEITRAELPINEDVTDFDFIANAGALLSGQTEGAWWAEQSWRNLTRKLLSLKSAPTVAEFTDRLRPFHRHLPSDLRSEFINQEITWISAITSQASGYQEIEEMESAYEALRDDFGKDCSVPPLQLSGKPEDLAYVLYQLSERPALTHNVSVQSSITAMLPMMTTALRSETSHLTPGVLEFILNAGTEVFEPKKPWNYDPLLNEAVAVASEASSEHTEGSIATLAFLAKLHPEAHPAIDAMIDAGHLQARFNEALAADDRPLASNAITLFILRGKPFSSGAKTTWQGVFGTQADILEVASILERLREFLPRMVWKSYYDSQDSKEIVLFLMEALVHSDKLGKNEIKEVSNYTDYYLRPLSSSSRYKLARLMGRDERLISNVGREGGLSNTIVQVFRYFMNENISAAPSQIEERLELVSSEDWNLAISGKRTDLLDAMGLASSQFKMGVQSRLLQAMCESLPLRTGITKAEKDRWASLYDTLTPAAKRKLLEAALQLAASDGELALSTLNFFGQEITEKDAFGFADVRANAVVQSLMPMKDGRTWLEAHAGAVQTGLRRLPRGERVAMREELKRMSTDRRGDRAPWSERMLKSWGL